MPPAYLGEFEQQVLLVILRLGSDAFGPDIARELEVRAGRRVSRGALYTTVNRPEDKGLIRRRTFPGTKPTACRGALFGAGGRPAAVRRARRRRNLWDG